MRRLLAALALVLVVGCSHPGFSPTVQEDDPAWNCHTMGNRVCGP